VNPGLYQVNSIGTVSFQQKDSNNQVSSERLYPKLDVTLSLDEPKSKGEGYQAKWDENERKKLFDLMGRRSSGQGPSYERGRGGRGSFGRGGRGSFGRGGRGSFGRGGRGSFGRGGRGSYDRGGRGSYDRGGRGSFGRGGRGSFGRGGRGSFGRGGRDDGPMRRSGGFGRTFSRRPRGRGDY